MKLIAAVDKNWGIGVKDALLFRIPEDMRRFRALTLANTVVMGRKTLLTLPGGVPLKDRENIVFTRSERLHVPGAAVCHSVSMLAALLENPPYSGKEVFVIGGAEIYALLLPYCEAALITHVHQACEADCFFPALDGLPSWTPYDIGPDRGGFSYVEYRNTQVRSLYD